jgi:hypothetical protein
MEQVWCNKLVSYTTCSREQAVYEVTRTPQLNQLNSKPLPHGIGSLYKHYARYIGG